MAGSDGPRFSVVGFAVALVTVGVGTAAGLAYVPVAGSYVGMLTGGFVAGLVREERPLLESGVAAVLASVGVLVAGALVGAGVVEAVAAVASVPVSTLLVSGVLAFAVGAFGANFGDDLRDGLTEPVEAETTSPGGLASTRSHSSATGSTDAERGASDEQERVPDERANERDADVAERDADVAERERDTVDEEAGDVEFERET